MKESFPNRKMFARLVCLHRIFKDRYERKISAGLTYAQLAEELKRRFEREFASEAPSERTLRRDLEFLRKRLGMPLVNDRGPGGGWCYTKETLVDLPILQASVMEVLALLTAKDVLERLHGKVLSNAVDAVLHRLWNEQDLANSDLVRDRVVYKSIGGSLEPNPLFELIAEAVLHARPLVITYRKFDGTHMKDRVVQPYLLHCFRDQWHVVVRYADSTGRNALPGNRDIALNLTRILEASVIPETTFRRDPKFDAKGYAKEAFGVFTGEGNYAIAVEFSATAAPGIRNRYWHASQRLEECPGGRVRLHLQLSSLVEVTSWILGYGPEATAIAPPELVGEVSASLSRASYNYSNWKGFFG